MAYSADSPRKCQGECGQRKPRREFDSDGSRVCRACRQHKPSQITALGDGTAAVQLFGKHAHGRFAYVSEGKISLVEGFRWRVMEYIRPNGVKIGPYAVSKRPTGHRGGEMVYMHRLITGYARVDHENRYPLDNTDGNLRDATQSQNGANRAKRRSGGTSDFKGVGMHKPSGQWRARIKIDYKEHYLGLFGTDEIAAARAADRAAIEEWGEFALTNVRLGLLPPEDGEA